MTIKELPMIHIRIFWIFMRVRKTSRKDPSIVFGIPQVGCMDMRGQYAENHQLSPDIEVYNTPEKALAGEDQQLEAAVQEMLKTIGEKK